MIGRTLGTFTVLEKIGAGGMGEVYRAHDASLGDRDASIEALERAFRERSPNLYFLKLMPRIFPDRIYADPRYRSLLERMRL